MLHMLKIGATQYYHDPLAVGINDIQELSKTQIWHRLLTHYLPLYFPEAERFKGNSRSDWFLAFLDQFPTPASITAMDEETFIEAAWGVVGRKVSKRSVISNNYEIASSSIALPVSLDSPAIDMFRMVLSEARGLIRQRDQIEKHAEQMLGTHPDYLRLRQILDLSRNNSGHLIERTSIKETEHDAKTRNRISQGSGSAGTNQWT